MFSHPKGSQICRINILKFITMKKYLFIVFLTSVTLNSIAQSFSILPNSASSNALNTTANRVGINTANPNYELQINRNGYVNTFAQFTNNITNRTATDGMLVGINSEGDGIISNQNTYPLKFMVNQKERFTISGTSLLAPAKLSLESNGLQLRSEAVGIENNFISDAGNTTMGMYASYNTDQNNNLLMSVYKSTESGTLVGLNKARMTYIYTGSGISNILFRSQSNGAFHFSGVNNIAMSITTINNNIGIGITAPTRKLDVNGDVRFGTNGTTITSFITSTQSADLPSIPVGGFYVQDFIIGDIIKGKNSVIVSPDSDIDLIGISYAWVSANNTVSVRFRNQSNSAIDIPNMPFHITVVTYP